MARGFLRAHWRLQLMELEVKDSTQRILDVAEALFMDRGYSAITLRDIADELGIKQASLYYHFPAGKEQLFVAMAERLFERHRDGLEAALAGAGANLSAQLRAVADWFSSQPPVKILGMFHADIPALNREHVQLLEAHARDAMYLPLRKAFVAAQERGEIRPCHPDLLAGSFLWLMDGLSYGQTRLGAPSREVMADDLISILLDGLRPRNELLS
jgi:TetR/AcrR family transcriptional regulator, cholesterol catabolism regulator